MVCRENKARSTTMGYLKTLLRRAGYADFSDHELQSMIHEQQHAYSAASDPDPETYVAYLKGLRQQIVNDPELSDGEKFRSDTGRASQPGFVTRIDQELERFRSGQYTDPVTGEKTKLTKAQMNLGANFAAMARLGQPVARAQHAKSAYCELYARHTGVPMEEAQARLRELVARPQAQRMNTQITLRDNWRDELAVAGLSAQQQSDMGQSNPLREALRLMEHERQSKIASLPRRPALREEHQIPILSADDPRAKVQCVGGCGQYGHTADNCPNAAQVQEVERAEQQYQRVRGELEQQTKSVEARQVLHDVDSGEVETIDTPEGPMVMAPSQKLLPPDSTELRSELTELADQYDETAFKKAAAATKKARTELDGAQTALDDARGPLMKPSSFVTDMAYNPENGTIAVTVKSYRLKNSKEERPPRTYMYRMNPEEYERMMASDNFDSAVSNTLVGTRTGHGVYGGNQRFRFDNKADAEAAKTQRQCPSCGQWASLNTSHACPVTGSMSGADEHRYREQLRAARERAKLAKLPVLTQKTMPRHTVMSQATATLPDKGRLSFPHPREAERITSTGGVAIGLVSGQYLGAQVTGRMFVWKNRGTGENLYQMDKMRCSCGRDDCRHIEYATSGVGMPYRARRVHGVPGVPDLNTASKDNVSHDGDVDRSDHVPYAAIQKQRAANRSRTIAYMHDSPFQHDNWPTRPRTADGRSIDPREVPARWSSSGGGEVNLNHPSAVADEVRSRLNEKTGQNEATSNWQVSVDGSGGVWIRSKENRTGTHGRMFLSNQKALADAFGMPSLPGGRGVYIAPDRPWRHEMLDRLSGVAPRYRAPRMITGPRDTDAGN